jgi:hypothetical protein
VFLCIAAVALLDAASFLAATAALLALRVRGAKPERDPEPRANVAGAGHVARTRDLRVMVLGCVGMAIFAIGALLMADSALPVVLAVKALFGLGLPWIVVATLTLLQRSMPPRLQGWAFAPPSSRWARRRRCQSPWGWYSAHLWTIGFYSLSKP